MKVKELVERAGIEKIPTGRVIAYIKDVLVELNTISENHLKQYPSIDYILCNLK